VTAAPSLEVAGIAAGDATILAFRRNIVVAASAGTGKTHRLTALYVLLTLGLTSSGQPDARTPAPAVLPDRILATTFSRAAALEISRRIERALAALATWDGASEIEFAFTREIRARLGSLRSGLGEGAQADGGAVPEAAEIRKRASEALAKWPASRIDTLHGAARQIVQRYALDLGVPPSARVLDEDESQALGVLAVDEALTESLSEGGARAQAARSLIVSCGGVSAAHREVTRLLDRLDEEGITPRQLARADHADQAADMWRDLFAVARRSAESGSRTFRELAQALADSLARGAPGEPLSDTSTSLALELFSLHMPRSGKTPADEELDAFRKRFAGPSHADRALRLTTYLRESPRLSLREEQLVTLLELARARLAAARRRAGGLSFGDLLRIAQAGLRDRPDIARVARGQIDALLVDEFQDTSRVQRDLVYLLRERDEAAAARRPGEAPRAEGLKHHGLFLVGDRKQSIYGFRGADVSVFARVCAELAGRAAGEALSLPPALWADEPLADFVALRESRRSGERVLAFVNAFSARDFSPETAASSGEARDFEIAYGKAEHLVPVPSAAGQGEVILIADDGSSPEDAEPLVREASGSMREAFVAAAYVAARVRRGAVPRPDAQPQQPEQSPQTQHQKSDSPQPEAAANSPGGQANSPAARPSMSYRDIAILARRRSTIPLIELALARLNVPYVVAGRALYDAPEVRDVAALLRLLLDPRDRLSLATVLRGPMVALSDTSLALLSLPGHGLTVPQPDRATPTLGAEPSPDEPLAVLSLLHPAERARLETFRARFADLRRAALRLTPGEAVRAALSALDLDRVIAALPRAEARLGNLDRLVSIARQRGGSLASFVRWLDRRIREDADEAEAAVFSPEDDAVRLTTIHASKGLDFPVVVLVDLNAQPRPSYGSVLLAPGSARRPASLVVRHYARRPARPDRPDLFAAFPDASDLLPFMPLTTPALRDAQTEAVARENAERKRLTYVAITRARRSLVLLGVPSAPRGGSAWKTLTAHLEDADFASTVTHREDARALLAEATRAVAAAAEAAPKPQPPPLPTGAAYYMPVRSPARTIALGVTPLSVFSECPRRFRLRHLLGLEEPVATGQLDLFGAELAPELPEAADDEPGPAVRSLPASAAHRVLERWPLARFGSPTNPLEVASRLAAEGLVSSAAAAGGGSTEVRSLAEGIAAFLSSSFARSIREEGASILREEPFVLSIPSPGAGRTPPRTLALRGSIDLLIERKSGLLDIIEYKLCRARADLAPYAFQLRCYALAVARRAPGRPVRAGVVYLGSSPEPVALRGSSPNGGDGSIAPAELDRFEQDLATLAHRYADARHTERFEGVAAEACKRLGCGFINACHPGRR
jgi:ATP-dependent helicase/nuclease subunit A